MSGAPGARFAGRVALVTGAASGIGRATALRLGAEGAAVACVDRDEPGAKATATAIASAGGRAYQFFMPIRRLSTPEEQAAAIAFLLSDDASYVNGVSLDVNGGLFMA